MSSTLQPAIWLCDTDQQIPNLTAVKWPWCGSPIINCKDVSYMHKLTQVDLCVFFGHHLPRLRRLINIVVRSCHEPLAREIGQPLPTFTTINKVTYNPLPHLSPRYGHVTLVSRFLFWQLSIDMNIQCHLGHVNLYVTLCSPSLHGWGHHIGVTPPPSSETVRVREQYC